MVGVGAGVGSVAAVAGSCTEEVRPLPEITAPASDTAVALPPEPV